MKKVDEGTSSCSCQVTISSFVKSKDMREGYIKMCTLADIPLEKTEKIRPFLLKHCKQAGALPQVKHLRTAYNGHIEGRF